MQDSGPDPDQVDRADQQFFSQETVHRSENLPVADTSFNDNDDWDDFQENQTELAPPAPAPATSTASAAPPSSITAVLPQPCTLFEELSRIFPTGEGLLVAYQGSQGAFGHALISRADDIRFMHWNSCHAIQKKYLESLTIQREATPRSSPVRDVLESADCSRLRSLSAEVLEEMKLALASKFEELSAVLVKELSAKDALLQEKVRCLISEWTVYLLLLLGIASSNCAGAFLLTSNSLQEIRNQLISGLVRMANRLNVQQQQVARRKKTELHPFSDTIIPYAAAPLGPSTTTCEQLTRVLQAWELGQPDFPALLREYEAGLRAARGPPS